MLSGAGAFAVVVGRNAFPNCDACCPQGNSWKALNRRMTRSLRCLRKLWRNRGAGVGPGWGSLQPFRGGERWLLPVWGIEQGRQVD